MAEAFWWGLLAGSSLILGGLVSLWLRVADRWIGHIMAFGGGVLISAVAFELVEEGIRTAGGIRAVAAGLFAGSLVFYVGDTLIDRMGGADRKRMNPAIDRPARGVAGLAIVLGIVLDGIPESIVIGLTLLEGGVIGVAIVVAVFLSNLPEAIAATTGLRGSGWSPARIMGLWALVTLVSAAAAVAGFALFDSAAPGTIAFVLGFAGGAILTMLADTMMPEAFEHSGRLVGVVTTLGFATAVAVDSFS
jgi:ZIP family zinc transporter